VPRQALETRFRDTSVQEIAREALRIARMGLRNRRRINVLSQDETIYLTPLEGLVASGKTVADELLERYEGPWRRNIDHIFEEFAF
jgi:glutamate--cysteine ligase